MDISGNQCSDASWFSRKIWSKSHPKLMTQTKMQYTNANFKEFFILFMTSNHHTTNFVFPNFFHEFFSVLPFFFKVLDQWKVCFLFQLLKLRKILGKNWGKRTFLSLSSWKRKQAFHWSKTLKKLLKLRRVHEKNWRKQDWLFGGLMGWTRY